MKLKRKSWHFWLVKFGRQYDRHDYTDICAYTKAVAAGAARLAGTSAMILVTVVLVAFVLVSLGSVIGWLATGLPGGWGSPPDLVKMGLIIWLALSIVGGMVAYLHRSRRPAAQRNRQPGFLKLAFQSWRGKFCIKIDLE